MSAGGQRSSADEAKTKASKESKPDDGARPKSISQVDPEKAKLSRKDQVRTVPPPGLMGPDAGPAS